MTLVRFCKKNCGFWFGFSFPKLTAVSLFLQFGFLYLSVNAFFHLCLYGMMYFCAELVQLIVGSSDSELEVQRYGMKKKTVYPIMLEDEL